MIHLKVEDAAVVPLFVDSESSIPMSVSEVFTGGELSDAVKEALLQIASKVAYVDGDGQEYYDDLYNALYPGVVLVSINADYTQSGTVYDTATLDSLKTDLVVTATYSDTSTSTVPSTDYTLSGTLSAGTSTVTVTYEDKTTAFTVTVTHEVTDTTAQINESGKIFIHKSAAPQYITGNATNGGTTIVYEMDQPTTTLFPAGIIPTESRASMVNSSTNYACLFIYDSDGTPVNFVNELTGSSYRWVQPYSQSMTEFSNSYTVATYSKIAFSVDMRYLDDAYMYDKATGQVWFAGINTPYYGMSNISEAS